MASATHVALAEAERQRDQAIVRAAKLEDENERLRAAGKKIIEADDEFRASLGSYFEGDPVSDACDAARDLFCLRQQPQERGPADLVEGGNGGWPNIPVTR